MNLLYSRVPRWRSSLIMFVLCSIAYVAHAASPNGANIPALSQIVDGQSHVWTTGVGGIVYKDGVKDATSVNVILLLYFNGTIYQENSSHNWWSYDGSSWAGHGAIGDPRTVTANGASIPSISYLVDRSAHVWVTGSGGILYEDGVKDATSVNVVLLLDYYGIPYQKNASGNWWRWNGSSWISVSQDPRNVATQSISAYANCDGVTDSALGVANAFAAAKNGAFNLIVDCPVFIHTGMDIGRAIFIDSGTTVIHSGSGKFILDNVMTPAFVIANSININLFFWNVQYVGSMPVNNNVGGYYNNGVWVAVSNSYDQPAQAFNNTRLRQWLTTNKGILFNGVNPTWLGANTFATFLLSGDTANVNVMGMNAYSPPDSSYSSPNESATHFFPFLFTFGVDYKSNQSVSSSTPTSATYYGIPHALVFTDITLDGSLMAFVGNLQQAVFKNISSRRYSDLQDYAGANVGGVNSWFPPPHLFYFRDDASTTDLLNQGITILNVIDFGTRTGVARDPTSGNALSLKIGATNSSVTNYQSFRPDGFLDLLTSTNTRFSNLVAIYDSSFCGNKWPAVRFPIQPQINVTLSNVAVTDVAAGTYTKPVYDVTDAATSLVINGFNIYLKQWSGTGVFTPSIGGATNDVQLNYFFSTTSAVLQKAQKDSMWATLGANVNSAAVGSSVTLTLGTYNVSSCTAGGAWSGSLGTGGTRTVSVTAKGISTYSVSCTGSAGTVVANVQVSGT